MHGDCRFHVVCSVVRLGIARTIGPLWFPFRVMVDFHRAVVFAFQVVGSRLQGRLSACVSRLAYRVSSVNWGRLGPAHMSLQLAALPPGKMRLTQGSTFRFFFQGLLSLGHLGALLQIRLPGYQRFIRDFKELRGRRTGLRTRPRKQASGVAGCRFRLPTELNHRLGTDKGRAER